MPVNPFFSVNSKKRFFADNIAYRVIVLQPTEATEALSNRGHLLVPCGPCIYFRHVDWDALEQTAAPHYTAEITHDSILSTQYSAPDGRKDTHSRVAL